jgi:ABC-type multidrug transport system fused ATPase/permease subunit
MFNKTKETLINVNGNLWRLLKISWQTDRKLTVGYYGSAGIAALFPIVGSFIYKLYIDNLIANLGIKPNIPLVILALLGSRYLSNWIWDFVSWVLKETYFDYLLRYKLQNYFSRMFARKMAGLDLQHLEDSKTQDLINKARDTLTWRPPDFLRAFSYLFTNIVSYVSSFLLLAGYGWHLPFVISLFGLPRLYLRSKLGSLQWSIWGSGAPDVRKLWYLQWLLTQKNSIVESKIFGSQAGLLKKYESIQDDLYAKNEKPVRKFIKIASFPQLFESIVLFVFAVVKLPQVLSGSVSVGDFTFFIDMLDRVANSVSGMVGNLGWMYENNLYVNHFFEVMGLKKIIKSPVDPVAIPNSPNPPDLEFRNVSFRYPDSKKFALKNVSFKLESGKNIALVGKNGAGKTTIVKLVCRFYDVTGGVILINGVNIKDIDLGEWYKKLGTLFQEFTKYDFTVRENIIQGDLTHFDKERMLLAARKSGADKFISGFPKKYEQILGKQFEGGIELSVGQWQKIAIARAFYAMAPILILDEPTSAIDAETEYKIFKNLDTEYKNKSLLLISHRFSTVRNADKIIVISKGEIKEEGTHEELIEKNGMYARMFGKQAEGYK